MAASDIDSIVRQTILLLIGDSFDLVAGSIGPVGVKVASVAVTVGPVGVEVASVAVTVGPVGVELVFAIESSTDAAVKEESNARQA
jgi:hypothetical protein